MAGRPGGAAVPAPHSAAVLFVERAEPRDADFLSPATPPETATPLRLNPCTGNHSMIPSRVLRRRATVLLQPRLTAEHRDLMTEHHDLGVLGCLAAAEHHQAAEDPDGDQVEQAKGHEPRSCRNRLNRPNGRSQHGSVNLTV